MTEPLHHFLDLADHEIHVAEWGTGNPETVILWHGLARTGADFAPLAAALSKRYRVLAPDTPGRGLSQWARAPERDYGFERYGACALALADLFGLGAMRWIGTSMGGALGMRLAAGPLKGRITHLVVNDIGPELPAQAVERILSYVGHPPVFDRMNAFEAYLRRVYAPYGHLSDTEWRTMAITSARRLPDGSITPHYDPRIVDQFVHHSDDYVLWDDFDRIEAPMLVLRGAVSDLLPEETAARMAERGPRVTVMEVPGCGHAPALNVPRQINPIVEFLTR